MSDVRRCAGGKVCRSGFNHLHYFSPSKCKYFYLITNTRLYRRDIEVDWTKKSQEFTVCVNDTDYRYSISWQGLIDPMYFIVQHRGGQPFAFCEPRLSKCH